MNFPKSPNTLSETNGGQHTARKAYDPNADAIRGLIKQVDLLYKLAARVTDLGGELAAGGLTPSPSAGEGRGEGVPYDRRAATKLIKQLDEQRKTAVYFHRQVAWLQERFLKAELEAVPG